jgi:SAM-dependent methyltransferase
MSFWDDKQFDIDIDKFRTDNNYLGLQSIYPYEYIIDKILLLKKPWFNILKEDGAFSVLVKIINGTIVSRDLLDSILEFEFLESHCGLPLDNIRVIDIGSGYGRFAHRLTTAYPNSYVYCADTIPISLKICKKYLDFRNVKNAEVVSTVDLNNVYKIDLAVCIHSFEEFRRADINWWLDWLVEHNVLNLFIIPRPCLHMLCLEDEKSFRPDIEKHGYKLVQTWRPIDCAPRDFYLFRLEK